MAHPLLRHYAKRSLRWIVPYDIWLHLQLWALRRRNKRRSLVPNEDRFATTELYDSLIHDLVSFGCDEAQVRDGSMPAKSLKNVVSLLERDFGASPVAGLHIGNFVGVSLTYLTLWMVNQNSASQMVSIDPNISHRGVARPMEQVLRLLDKSGLNGNSMVLTGYSLQKEVGNDGKVNAEGDDPLSDMTTEVSCEKQLQQLAALCPGRFQFAVIDGNHDGAYFSAEVVWVNQLLAPGGLIIVDDVSDGWVDIQKTFAGLTTQAGFQEVFKDGRIGVMRKS